MTGGELDQLRFLASMIVDLQTALHKAERTIAALQRGPVTDGLRLVPDDASFEYFEYVCTRDDMNPACG